MSPALVASRTGTVPDDDAGPSAGGATFFGAGDVGSGVKAQVTGSASGFDRFGIRAGPALGSVYAALGAPDVVVGEVNVGDDAGPVPMALLASGSRRKPG
jgi:hypothetical protein